MTKIKYDDWKDCFPKGYSPRELQIDAINQILNAFITDDKTYFVLQAPVGTGKSFIAATVANFYKNRFRKKSYILTTQIILQNQYLKEFENFSNIYSRSNYDCRQFPKNNCSDMKMMHSNGGVKKCDDCIYEEQKQNFIHNNISVTNTSFFLTAVQHNEQLVPDRELLIVDECHNLEEDVIRYKGIDINLESLQKKLNFKQEQWPSQNKNLLQWFEYDLKKFLNEKIDSFTKLLQNKSTNQDKVLEYSKKKDYAERLLSKLQLAINLFDLNRWVLQNKEFEKIISMTPLFANDFTEDSLFSKGNKILLMSGTILNKESYCNSLGIDIDDTSFISLDSPFPIKNRKIHILNSGSMSYKSADKTYPNLIKNIEKILKTHSLDKGIIHVSSHKLAKQIQYSLQDDRIIIAGDFKNRDSMLEHHGSMDNTVLISPSMKQGVDLKDDLSRFQIIAKVPFPSLVSKYVSTKMKLVKDWYSYQTAKSIVQSYGRSIRSDKDYAETYILDGDILWFIKMNMHLFPNYFLQAIQ